MWQKQLKTLQRQLVKISKEQTKHTQNSPEQQPTVSFRDYCEEAKITPLIQDKIVLPKIRPTTTQNNFSSRHKKIGNQEQFEFFDQNNCKNEFFRFGQKLLPKDLRNGRYPIYGYLDLHNFNSQHALELLERFIETAPAGKCLRIIHGVGLNSMNNQPILMGLVRKFLEHHPRISGFSYGSPKQGGNGVTIVKLTSS